MSHPAIEELKLALRDHYGARLIHLVLFGSRARGDGAPESDFDVLVVLQGVVEPETEIAATGALVAGISLRHDVVLSCVFVPEAAFRHETNPLLLNIRREGITL